MGRDQLWRLESNVSFVYTCPWVLSSSLPHIVCFRVYTAKLDEMNREAYEQRKRDVLLIAFQCLERYDHASSVESVSLSFFGCVI